MRTDSPQADTRIMAIVHAALRRDLDRTRAELAAQPYPRGRQRRALGEHAVWMMEFLHDHHTGEDEGLWPLVRERDPAAGPLLDSLEAEHRRIGPAIAAFTAAGRRYAATTGDDARVELAEALDALTAVLVPHLEREVDEAMPVVSASVTRAEWHAWDQAYNVKPKSFVQLGMVGHWLLDGIDAEGYQVVVREVPAVPRFLLLHGFARPYRRRAAARWRPEVGTP
ncbi:hemerythrin domain-containing protein [Microtetraspora fusca]|uniref:hemerythrin domain-containing protein n=1 Tax=Microtetraspora fusca TaxID=1997 RepID=UPI0009FBA153|nr:hemerythrin domain-containing protein [Microtetraspora fusca]